MPLPSCRLAVLGVLALVAVCALALPTGSYIQNPEDIHHSMIQSEAQVFEDFGITAEEAWDCGWYGQEIPRAAVSLATCKDYLHERLINCVEWTKAYGTKYPRAERHISMDEVYIKCRHVKDTLDQRTELPGDTASCIWCMQNVNTN